MEEPIKGAQFLLDEHGRHKSVILDLEVWGKVWETFYNDTAAEIAQREGRPVALWAQVKAEMEAQLKARLAEYD